MRNKTENRGGTAYKIAVALLGSVIALFALLAIMAAVMVKTDLPDGVLVTSVYAAVALVAFFCGRSAARAVGRRGIFAGLAAGAALFVILFACGVFSQAQTGFSMKYLLPVCALIPAALGGIGGVKR